MRTADWRRTWTVIARKNSKSLFPEEEHMNTTPRQHTPAPPTQQRRWILVTIQLYEPLMKGEKDLELHCEDKMVQDNARQIALRKQEQRFVSPCDAQRIGVKGLKEKSGYQSYDNKSQWIPPMIFWRESQFEKKKSEYFIIMET
ncbi:hypothetical protein E5288_WYG003433 [Bos mutus]|uniref:Uncharacterized protein n=1 Tax=Bos mutus TaxID=72004 RepID=A0A6B0S8X3_9CETA|nr:hypothetical protein [Bos mutus]